MGHLGATAGPVAGDQTREMAARSGPKGVNSKVPLAMVAPSPEMGRGVDSGFRSPTVIGVSD